MDGSIILQDAELRELFNVHRLLHFLGEPSAAATDKTVALTPADVLDLYELTFKDSQLTVPNIILLLTHGGYIKANMPIMKVFIKLSIENFVLFSVEEQKFLCRCAPVVLSNQLNKLMKGYQVTKIGISNPEEIIVQRFIALYTRPKITRFTPLKSKNRAEVNNLYTLYCMACISVGYSTNLTRKEFVYQLTNLGYHIKKGYAAGRSGVQFVDELLVPVLPVEVEAAITYGIGLFQVQFGDTFDLVNKQDQPLSEFTLDQLHLLIETRRERLLHESEATTIGRDAEEEKEKELDDRRRAKMEEEATRSEEKSSPLYLGSYEKDLEDISEDALTKFVRDNKTEQSVEDTVESSEDRVADPEDNTQPDDPSTGYETDIPTESDEPDGSDGDVESGESIRGNVRAEQTEEINGTIDVDLSEAEDEADEIEMIATAVAPLLKTLYSKAGSFNKEVFVKMFPGKTVEDYNSVMEYIKFM